MRRREADSSIRSMALSGKNRPVMYRSREHGRRDEGRVGDANPVVHLITLFEPAQYSDRVFNARGVDDHRLESSLESRVFFDVFAILVEGRGADHAQFAPGQHGLEHVGGVHRSFGGTGPDDGVQLIEEGDDLAFRRLDFGQYSLEALFELSAVLGTGHHGAQVECHDTFALQPLGDVAVPDSSGRVLRRWPSCQRPARR